MTPPRLVKILRSDDLCRTRAVAINSNGEACRLFECRWGGDGETQRFGMVQTGHIRSIAPEQGGAFAALSDGSEAFVRDRADQKLAEGQSVHLQIRAEARRDKLARAVLVEQATAPHGDAYKDWAASLPGAASLETVEDTLAVQAAFDDVLSPSITLPGGGQLHIDRTRALIAFDVDLAGRIKKGSAGARALSVNREAAMQAARILALRDYGGVVILDCVGPLNKEAGAKVRAAFQETFQAYSKRQVKTLAPSEFGLLQATIAWKRMPIEDRILDQAGQPTAETVLLDLLYEAAREAASQPAHFFDISLCAQTRQAYLSRQSACDAALKARFSGRIRIVPEIAAKNGVTRR